jgi:transposase
VTTAQRWRQLTLTLHDYTEKARSKGFYRASKTSDRCWWRYDGAQVHEVCDVLESIGVGVDVVSRDLARCLSRPKGLTVLRGRPGKDPADLAKAVLVQQYVEMANRPLEGALCLYAEKIGLRERFGYKDVERAYSNPDVTVLLLGLLELTVKAVRDESEFSVDGTGLSTSMKDNWESYVYPRQGRQGDGKRRYSVFEKLVCAVGQRYGLVSAFRVLDSMHGHESPYLKPLVEELAERHERVDLVNGDAAYFSRDNCDIVAGVGGVPRFFPKKNATLRSLGSKPYQDMLLSFIRDPQAWLEEYHRRYICESTFSSLKRRCLTPLRRKLGTRRRQEVLARIIIYNLIRLSHARWTQNLKTNLKITLNQKHR